MCSVQGWPHWLQGWHHRPDRWLLGPLHAQVNPTGGSPGRPPTLPPIGPSCAGTGYHYQQRDPRAHQPPTPRRPEGGHHTKVACNSPEPAFNNASKRWNCNTPLSIPERLTGKLHATLFSNHPQDLTGSARTTGAAGSGTPHPEARHTESTHRAQCSIDRNEANTTNYKSDFPARQSQKVTLPATRFVHPHSWSQPTKMPTFPHQKAKKSFYQQHALSYNPTSPQPITLHGEHVSNHEADENPSHTERQAKKKKPAAASSINKKTDTRNRVSDFSVELGGFEPPTSSMPWKRATNCAIAPLFSSSPRRPDK